MSNYFNFHDRNDGDPNNCLYGALGWLAVVICDISVAILKTIVLIIYCFTVLFNLSINAYADKLIKASKVQEKEEKAKHTCKGRKTFVIVICDADNRMNVSKIIADKTKTDIYEVWIELITENRMRVALASVNEARELVREVGRVGGTAYIDYIE